ncbi:alpha/beta-hydrolase [Trichoderma chlorosporum]
MDTSKLKPNDPRVKYETKQIRGKTYSYILGEPEGPKVDTVVLAHGWPDLAFGWRHQIPYLMSLGYQVIAPNMLGYAGTDAPQDLKQYSLKNVSDDVAELARHFVGQDGQIVLGGHDWGGFVIWRLAYYHPTLVKAIFSVCTPMAPLITEYTPLEAIIASGRLQNFKYQLQLKGPDVEAHVTGKDKLRQFFKALFGGRDPNNELGFNMEDGILFDKLDKVRDPPLLDADEVEYYAEQYALQKAPELRGPLNWYRTREINANEEIALGKDARPMRFEQPSLFIAAAHDAALPPAMSKGMDKAFTNLTRAEVDASHWALTQAGPEVNEHIAKWLTKINSAPKL